MLYRDLKLHDLIDDNAETDRENYLLQLTLSN